MIAASTAPKSISAFLRAEPERFYEWVMCRQGRLVGFCVAAIVIGAGSYGAVMGCWRDPLQALYTAIKFPLIILLTATANAALNAMLAPLLGLNISFRQSFLAILMSFTIAGAILGSFAPIVAFVIWNAPPLGLRSAASAGPYAFILLTFVVVIAFAGVAANLRLLQLLRHLGGGRGVAFRVLLAWLVGNLFFGTQLSWVLRPFIGAPALPVQFLRVDACHGNFYETIFHTIVQVFTFD